MLTHIEIAHRASFYFADGPDTEESYKSLIAKHQDAFQAGNPYPDAMYAGICYSGDYHDVAEDSHWTPFMVATIDYIRENYPQPWNTTAEKLVVFLLGFVSHQVADVLWHNLGVQNGFLQSMADANFHGQFGVAHPIGDVGGDVVGSLEWNKSFVSDVSWYVPSTDLAEIYKRYYAAQGRSRNVTATVIETCTTLLFLARFGEKIAFEKLFDDYAKKSPFLVEELNQFYIGGLDDNAAWTTLLWHDAITMIHNGTNSCQHSKNPVDVHCPEQPKASSSDGQTMKSVPPVYDNILDKQYVDVEHVDGGIRLKPSTSGHELLHAVAKKHGNSQRRSLSSSSIAASVIYTSSVPYARLGWSYASGDLNGDSVADLVIGAPGYSEPKHAAIGCVYVIFGSAQGFPGHGETDIETVAHAQYIGQDDFSRFGSSVALVDFNADSHLDMVVGAPSTGTASLSYHGEVLVFLNTGSGVFPANPSHVIAGTEFHQNFGWSMAAGDVDGDGLADLLVSSPFQSTGDLVQSGVVNMYKPSNNTAIPSVTYASIVGPKSSGLFGSVLEVVRLQQQDVVLVGAPDASVCKAAADCHEFSQSDQQSVGDLSLYTMSNGKTFEHLKSFSGNVGFEKLGSSAAVGQMFEGVDVLAVSAPTADIKGKVLGIPSTLSQAGQVLLYNMSESNVTAPFAVLEGDRKFGRFGWRLAFADLNDDGIDDLVITAALRIDDFSEILYAGEQGAVYVFYGGNDFRKLKWPSVTRDCGAVSLESPCPAKVANHVLNAAEHKSRFGSSLHVVGRGGGGKGNTTLVVGAIHSNLGSRMSGTVYIFQ